MRASTEIGMDARSTYIPVSCLIFLSVFMFIIHSSFVIHQNLCAKISPSEPSNVEYNIEEKTHPLSLKAYQLSLNVNLSPLTINPTSQSLLFSPTNITGHFPLPLLNPMSSFTPPQPCHT